MARDSDGFSQPHDRLFKEIFGRTDIAAGFFQAYLPPALAAAADWASLSLQPGSFVDQSLAHRESDLLYRVRLPEGDGELWLYCLFEHQRRSDHWMALRLLGYLVRIWERFRQEQPAQAQLPPIVPVVLHQGSAAWSAPAVFHDLIAAPNHLRKDLAPWTPDFTFRLVDLAPLPFEELQGTILGRLALQALKAAGQDRLVEFWEQSSDLWDQVLRQEDALGLIRALLSYLIRTDSSVDKQLFRNRILTLVPEPIRTTAMSIADQLIEEGRQEGLRLGLVVAQIQAHQKFLNHPVQDAADLIQRPIEELQSLLESLEQAFKNSRQ